MENFHYVDINSNKTSNSIEVIFPKWKRENERVCVFSPHDDDAIIGAGYAMSAALQNGAEVFVFIFCRGNAGYSNLADKDSIEVIRNEETVHSFLKLGIRKENIKRFNYSDFSVVQNIGWIRNNNSEGSFKEVLVALREFHITRLLVPNHYREHLDHSAVSEIGTYYSPQAGDSILVDWADPKTISSILEYSVWADLSPEDSLTNRRNTDLRANKIIIASEAVEKKIREGIVEFKSQEEIINGLMATRVERSLENGKYIEVYLAYDPRPKLNYEPYKKFLKEIDQIK